MERDDRTQARLAAARRADRGGLHLALRELRLLDQEARRFVLVQALFDSAALEPWAVAARRADQELAASARRTARRADAETVDQHRRHFRGEPR